MHTHPRFYKLTSIIIRPLTSSFSSHSPRFVWIPFIYIYVIFRLLVCATTPHARLHVRAILCRAVNDTTFECRLYRCMYVSRHYRRSRTFIPRVFAIFLPLPLISLFGRKASKLNTQSIFFTAFFCARIYFATSSKHNKRFSFVLLIYLSFLFRVFCTTYVALIFSLRRSLI